VISLANESACRVFGINSASIDTFKEYFFTHGVFIFKCYSAPTPEYTNVLELFQKLLDFEEMVV